MYREMRYQD